MEKPTHSTALATAARLASIDRGESPEWTGHDCLAVSGGKLGGLTNGCQAHAAAFSVPRRIDHCTSGRKSSHRTSPPVAFSMAGQRSAGTRVFVHWYTVACPFKFSFLTVSATPPIALIARSIGVWFSIPLIIASFTSVCNVFYQ